MYKRQFVDHDPPDVRHRVGSRELLSGIGGDWHSDRYHRVDDAADAVADRDELMLALNRLPARMRTVLVLRYWEDLSEAQTAELLGCSLGSVKSQASRGLDRLRAALGPSRDGSVEAILGRRSL